VVITNGIDCDGLLGGRSEGRCDRARTKNEREKGGSREAHETTIVLRAESARANLTGAN
jgi:hypothetical protein